MKKTFLIVLSCFMLGAIHSQNIVKEHWTFTGGLLGAANFSQIRHVDATPSNIDYQSKAGWAAGLWFNFPVTTRFSVEPQLQYSSHQYETNSNAANLLFKEGKVKYISIPVQLKYAVSKNFAFALGPQFDFTTSVEDEQIPARTKDDVNGFNFSALAGIEFFPQSKVSLYGRYVYGLTNIDSRPTANSSQKYHTSNVQVGLKVRLFGKKVEADSDGDGVIDKNDQCPTVFGLPRYNGCPIPDTDKDGINDEEDKCPNEPGTAKYNGCPIPDTDKDGINDEMDKCPTQPGTAKYNGCPVPDSDGDGIDDEHDKCPNQAGPADRQGCPVTDKDNDGIPDDQDKCPDVAGVASNNGCPDVPANVSKTLGVSSDGIYFGATNAKLTTKSNAALNNVVTIMNDNPTLRIKVGGHTDNAGDDEKNMKLSQDRADAVKAYLVSKGIAEDRITAEGFGETMPIADNTTAAGRKRNTRIEIRVAY